MCLWKSFVVSLYSIFFPFFSTPYDCAVANAFSSSNCSSSSFFSLTPMTIIWRDSEKIVDNSMQSTNVNFHNWDIRRRYRWKKNWNTRHIEIKRQRYYGWKIIYALIYFTRNNILIGSRSEATILFHNHTLISQPANWSNVEERMVFLFSSSSSSQHRFQPWI